MEADECLKIEKMYYDHYVIIHKMSNKVYIEDYSEKAFVVRGDTNMFAESFTAVGGKQNNYLRGGPGWVFSKRHQSQIESLIRAGDKKLCKVKPTSKQFIEVQRLLTLQNKKINLLLLVVVISFFCSFLTNFAINFFR